MRGFTFVWRRIWFTIAVDIREKKAMATADSSVLTKDFGASERVALEALEASQISISCADFAVIESSGVLEPNELALFLLYNFSLSLRDISRGLFRYLQSITTSEGTVRFMSPFYVYFGSFDYCCVIPLNSTKRGGPHEDACGRVSRETCEAIWYDVDA